MTVSPKFALVAAFSVCVLISSVAAILHEDEVGKRDWYVAGIGHVEQASLVNTPALKQVLVASKQGVVAALSQLDKGNVRWRALLGEPQVCLSASSHNTLVVSARGVGYLFNTASGSVVQSFSLRLSSGTSTVTDCYYDAKTHTVFVAVRDASTVEVFRFHGDDDEVLGAGQVLPAKTITASSVVTDVKFAGKKHLWIERNGTGVDVVELDSFTLHSTNVRGHLEGTGAGGNAVLTFHKDEGSDEDAGRMVQLMTFDGKDVRAADGSKPTSCKRCRIGAATTADDGSCQAIITVRDERDAFQILSTFGRHNVAYPGYRPPRVVAAIHHANHKRMDVLLRASNGHLLHVSLTQDAAVLNWERFDGLSSPAAAKVVPLPLQNLASGALPERDLFGFHLHALVLSTYGTLYRVPLVDQGKNVLVVADVAEMLSNALPGASICEATYSDIAVSDAGVVTVVARIGGQSIRIAVEASAGMQVEVSEPIRDPVFSSPALMVDQSLKIHASVSAANAGLAAAVSAPTQYLYAVDRTTGIVRGFSIANASVVTPTWEVQLRSKIAAVAAPQDPLAVSTVEHLRVFPNTSKVNEVRRKYPTRNILVVAQLRAEDDVLAITVIDTITGSILATAQHGGVHGEVHMIVVEHAVLYHFFNVEKLRYSLGVLELFEHEDITVTDAANASPAQAVSSFFVSHKSFSSFTARPPIVAAMVLAFPGGALRAVGCTTSYQGINRKQVIFAMDDGRIHAVELKALLFGGQVNPQKPEEVYQHVMTPSQLAISHIHHVRQAALITTTPTELESSSHVLVSGLDLFYARVSPGKAYDMLNDDFKHELLLAVSAGMGILTLAARHFASRKALKLQWA